jgi:hypothetical protein
MAIWFAKSKSTGDVAMTRFEALALLQKVSMLISQEKIFEAMAAIVMDDSVFPEGQKLEEIFQAFEVRLADLMKYAGIKA